MYDGENALMEVFAEEWRSEEKSETHLHRDTFLTPLRTVLVVEGGVGVGKELVFGVLVEDQDLAGQLEWEVGRLVSWVVVY